GSMRPSAFFYFCNCQTSETSELVRKNFSLSPTGIIRELDLLRPIYKQTAAYGHFGRTDVDLPWEHTEKAAALREQAGL
ncbi:methionine adenosyltransferase domain-containing protein, partial [Phascolarctobacterium succinatutens]|uniref:methionine adenosyltransferase domain-containing protein n=1 Tax=Phascolarctobacterium succinatutens TaxID=626940 RepID=UPI004025960D